MWSCIVSAILNPVLLPCCLYGDMCEWLAVCKSSLQAVTGLHAAGVLHRDIKPENMLVVGADICLIDFDVSCLRTSSEETLQMRVGTEDFRSPLWQVGTPYREIDDLASLLLSFAWLLQMRTQALLVRINYLAELPNDPQALIDTAKIVLSTYQNEALTFLYVRLPRLMLNLVCRVQLASTDITQIMLRLILLTILPTRAYCHSRLLQLQSSIVYMSVLSWFVCCC